ncbi:BTAD domain-containing putative transcriptional regulator [Streptomyces sp. NBC_00083]|uniref:AfsR/SARP family transcriptional regulator n=1 Tax=Streptomyces sp. NBC_00083 TaxID=2975647 RepID=UPI0022512FC5|nr:BTAD domain-containing putative transcriptional regulator [Streptomyces sp. NBC_00083]MCX5388368.1 NB-ARC domain-containing protein [Streptomyces sp. NBC_00083]
MRFNILGSLEGWANGHRVRLGGPIQERVLTVLLLEANRVVPVYRLIEAAWEDEPPVTAVQQIRKAVAEIRRRVPGGPGFLLTEGAGYLVVVADEDLDLQVFLRETKRAADAAAAGRLPEAVAGLRTALALWRGSMMSGAGGPVVAAASAALDEHRLAATEQLFEFRLALGEDNELVGDLREAVGAHPLRERLRGRLMLALYRSGRQAEALAEYGRIRDRLADELGIDPGTELSRLHEGILRADPELAAPPRTAPVPASRAPELPVPAPASTAPRSSAAELCAPCTLPYDLTDFTGRERELGRLLGLARREGGAGERIRIVGIDGMGGSGKTTLAVHAAHRLSEAFPDGRLYVDLRGFTPGERPLQPDSVAGLLLKALGGPDTRVPDDEEARFALWRSAVANRRLLLILDNAADTAQLRPLLSAMPHGFVVVTGRVRLVDLDGVQWISLSSMAPDESSALLAKTLGEERLAAEPKAAAALAELCGHLPLALRIATAKLRNRPLWTLQYLTGRLRDESRLLKELSSSERSVATSVQLSYQALDPDHQRAFRMLGLHPGSDVDSHTAAALIGTSAPEAEESLEALLDAHLLRQQALGRYTFHDLVRSFARGLWQAGTAPESAALLDRLLDYYIAATDGACGVLFPGWVGYAVPPVAPPAELPPLGDDSQAARWFDEELPALRAAVALGHERGHHRQAAYLARNTMFHLHQRGDVKGLRETGELSVAAARDAQDLHTLRLNLINLSTVHSAAGDFRKTAELCEEGLRIVRSQEDRRGEGSFLDQLGWAHGCLGDLHEGRRYLQQAVETQQAVQDHHREAFALSNLSSLHAWLGATADAVAAARQAALLQQRIGAHQPQTAALNDLAVAHLAAGDPASARPVLDEALRVGEKSSMPRNLALTHALMADLCQREGRGERAPALAARALDLVAPLGARAWQCQIENIAGLVHRRRGEHRHALDLHQSAFRHASGIEFRIEIARALDGMAQALHALGDYVASAEQRRLADEHFDAMSVPEDFRRRS